VDPSNVAFGVVVLGPVGARTERSSAVGPSQLLRLGAVLMLRWWVLGRGPLKRCIWGVALGLLGPDWWLWGFRGPIAKTRMARGSRQMSVTIAFGLRGNAHVRFLFGMAPLKK